MFTAFMTGLTVFISTTYMAKRMEKRLKIWLVSQEGLTMMATLGAAAASGAMSQLKMGSPAKGIKIMGIPIPQVAIDATIAALMQKFGILQPQQQGLNP